jgi:hypothetical protein
VEDFLARRTTYHFSLFPCCSPSLFLTHSLIHRREYCQRVEDFLARRTRLAFLDVAAAEAAVNRVSGDLDDFDVGGDWRGL